MIIMEQQSRNTRDCYTVDEVTFFLNTMFLPTYDIEHFKFGIATIQPSLFIY